MKSLFCIILVTLFLTLPVLAANPIDTSINIFSVVIAGLGFLLTLISALGAVAFTLYKQLESLRKEFKLELNKLKIELESDIRDKINVHRSLQDASTNNYKEKLKEIDSSLDELWNRYENRGKRYTSFANSIGYKIEELLLAYKYIKEILEEDRQDLKDVFAKLGMAKHHHPRLKKPEDFSKKVVFKDTLQNTVEGERSR